MTAWMVDGLCTQTDPNLFILDMGESAKPAKKVCAACPVLVECREFALANDVVGVWGGTTWLERNRMKRENA